MRRGVACAAPFGDVSAVRDEGDVTRVLGEIRRGTYDNVDPLLPIVYAELQRLAQHQLRRERRDP